MQDLALHALARRLVEADEWLIHEDEIGIDGEGARDRHPLLHPTGDLVRVIGFIVAQPDDLDDLIHLAAHNGRRDLLDPQAGRHVVPDVEPGKG